MTTPERLRARQLALQRRQRIESLFVALLCAGLVASAIWTNVQDRRQRECVADQFSRLAASSKMRSALNERDSGATTTVILEVARARDDMVRVRAALDEFVKEQDAIAKARKENPVPPLPTGVCD